MGMSIYRMRIMSMEDQINIDTIIIYKLAVWMICFYRCAASRVFHSSEIRFANSFAAE